MRAGADWKRNEANGGRGGKAATIILGTATEELLAEPSLEGKTKRLIIRTIIKGASN